MSKKTKSSRRANNRKQALKGFAKQLVDFRPGMDMVNNLKKGNIVGALKSGFNHVKGMAGNIVTAITGRDSNSKSWYVVYKDVKPAANETRPMGALFNTIITKNPTNGSTCRYMEVLMEWEDFTDSYMWHQTISNSFKLLRLKLKSNLPYDEKRLSVYLNNAVQLAICLKQVERDVHWYNYSDPNWPDFSEMFPRRAKIRNGYGKVVLQKDALLSAGLWADTLSSYDRLVASAPSNLRLPPNLALFISHYFGTVFLDSCDGFNDQCIINRMTNFVWKKINPMTNEVETEELDATQLTVDDLTIKLTELGTEFGMVIADLINSEQYTPLFIDRLENYTYQFVYDKTFVQALQNAYTSGTAVTADKYIRLDRYPDVEDDLTQFIFAGGYAPREDGALANVPAITVIGQVLKYNSNASLEWPITLDQIGLDDEDVGYFKVSEPFGIQIVTDISADTYVSVNQSAGQIQYPWLATPELSHLTLKSLELKVGFSTDAVSSWMESMSVNYQTGAIAVGHVVGFVEFNDTNEKGVLAYFDKYSNETLSDEYVLFKSNKLNNSVLSGISNTAYQNFINGLGSLPLSIAELDILKAGAAYESVSISANKSLTTVTNNALSQTQFRIQSSLLAGQYEVTIKWNDTGTKQVNGLSYSIPEGNTSIMSFTSGQIISDVITDINTEVSLATGFTGLIPLASKETHAGIPMLYNHKVTTDINLLTSKAFQGGGKQSTTKSKATKPRVQKTYSSLPILVKHEHIPYYYNTVDLQGVLYDMFTSLFTPTNNIYELLLKRKGQYDQSRRDARVNKKKKKEETDKDKSEGAE